MPRRGVQKNVIGRNWTFTLNNYTEIDVEELKEYEDCRYLVFGKEVCPTTGTPHLQGYISFNRNFREAGVRKLNTRMHWELAGGTPKQASDYCKKGEQSKDEWEELHEDGPTFGFNADFFEKGEMPKSRKQVGQANKEKWADILQSAKDGNCEDEYPGEWIRYPYLRSLYRPKYAPIEEYTGVWYYGPPGTGKSLTARARYPNAFDKPLNKWWCNYSDEDNVLIDDIDKAHHFMGSFLKRYADHYPFPAEFKGGMMVIRPKAIVVTSNYSIADLFGDDEKLCAALQRRYVEIYLGEPLTPDERNALIGQ